MYLISIYFDEKTNNRIRQYINKVAKKTGNTFMIDGNVPPHVTISAFDTKKEEMSIAFQVLQNQFGAFKGEVTHIGLAKTNPYRDLVQCELKRKMR